MAEHFNKLTGAELERLACLSEELGEAQQIIGKIIRHGYESYDPTRTDKLSNRRMLEREVGDVLAILELMKSASDIMRGDLIIHCSRKLSKLQRWTHHQNATERIQRGEQ